MGFVEMKKISCVLGLAMITCGANASYDAAGFISEISRGVDIVTAPVFAAQPAPAIGELGADVYQDADDVDTQTVRVFVPSTMYVRMGGGLNLGFATANAEYNGAEYESSGSYTTQIGLGWNLSSYVRTELDFQSSAFEFTDLEDLSASYQTLGSMLYFDFARRYVNTGDVVRRRSFVPFMGVGAAFGAYRFDGTDGADGFVIAAPRAVLGFNIMFNDLIGLDVYYQYQLMLGNGFGWGNDASANSISNIMASIRANF